MTVICELGELAPVRRTNMAASAAVLAMTAEQLHHFLTQFVGKHMLQLWNHTVPLSVIWI